MNDPKSQILQDLLQASFWEHLADKELWLASIKDALEASSDYQLEQDNFRLQGEINVAMSVIAEQEIKLKNTLSTIKECLNIQHETKNLADKILQLRIKDRYYA